MLRVKLFLYMVLVLFGIEKRCQIEAHSPEGIKKIIIEDPILTRRYEMKISIEHTAFMQCGPAAVITGGETEPDEHMLMCVDHQQEFRITDYFTEQAHNEMQTLDLNIIEIPQITIALGPTKTLKNFGYTSAYIYTSFKPLNFNLDSGIFDFSLKLKAVINSLKKAHLCGAILNPAYINRYTITVLADNNRKDVYTGYLPAQIFYKPHDDADLTAARQGNIRKVIEVGEHFIKPVEELLEYIHHEKIISGCNGL